METCCTAGQATDDNMAHAHSMLATNTHAQYVILTAFPLQQWLQERASMLRYMYIGCLVIIETVSVYCAVRTKYLYIIQIKFRLQIQAALACFSCSPLKISFKIFAQIRPSKRHHLSSPCYLPSTKLSPNVNLLLPAAYPNSSPPITIPSSLPKCFTSFSQPTLTRRTSGHCLGTFRALNFLVSPRFNSCSSSHWAPSTPPVPFFYSSFFFKMLICLLEYQIRSTCVTSRVPDSPPVEVNRKCANSIRLSSGKHKT